MDYFEVIDERTIMCKLCHHHCKIKKGKTGMCGVNANHDNKLETLVYGYPASIAVDPIEKKPIYHMLPGSKALSFGTVGCNFRCPFCQNWQLSQEHRIDTSHYVSPENMVELAKEYGCDSIAYTYNEPTIFYPYAKDIAVLAKEAGLKNIYVSNGFESLEMIEDMKGLIDAVNIDLKSFDDHYYRKTLKGGLDEILAGLKAFKKAAIWVEVMTLIVPQDNDSDEELGSIAKFIAQELDVDTPWHVSAFHPDYKIQDRPKTAQETLDRAVDIGKAAGLHYIYKGNVVGDSNTYCPSCHELLIQRSGFGLGRNILDNGKCPHCDEAIKGVWK
jgi:pyruvate formate lyase activating enzyme